MSARSVLLTILGELVQPAARPAWTSSLVELMGALGVEERAARQAIARGAAAGWISPEKRGRHVRWHLTPEGVELLHQGSTRLASLSNPPTTWDGDWFVLLVNIPHDRRGARRKLYGGLTWAGFGNPLTGTWVSPHRDRATEINALVTALGLRSCTLSFLGKAGGVGLSDLEIVELGWDLEALRVGYEEVLGRVDDVNPDDGWERLVHHVQVVTQWQRMPRSDPQLPRELLPDWIGWRAAQRMEEISQAGASQARAAWDVLDGR